MAKIRYQLIRPLKPGPNEESIGLMYLKGILALAVICLIVLYYNRTPQTQYVIPPETTEIATEIPAEIQHNSTALKKKFNNATVPNYFVYTPNCRMPAVNPFAKDVLKIFHKTAYKKCDRYSDFITVNYDNNERRYSLHINKPNVSCCFKPILRSGERTEADNLYKLLPCGSFHQDFQIPKEIDAIITECRRQKDHVLVQQDAFGFVQPKDLESSKSVGNASLARRPSVLLWGIDSMSRMNFQRTMPQMYKYLKAENWFELQGYNKMGDNTFPNLMAVLTGFNNTRSQTVCRPHEVGGMDACPMLWKYYKYKGYYTAYSEDWSTYATFNHLLRGFRNPPTDYYARPFILAIEKELKKEYETGIPYCVGRKHYAEYVYDAAVQFTKVYQNQSNFGMFWTNSFSHNNFALPTSMDGRLLAYMRALNQSGTFENSIVVFFSDHGMRFGDLRNLENGYLEERMPILYIWLPKWFRAKYPEFSDGLQLNRNRLTSPYDIYATLRHILELETPKAHLPLPEGCPKCHSVFFEVDESRGCKDVGIDDHWCTCQNFERIAVNDATAKLIAEQLVSETNIFLVAGNYSAVCQTLKLSNIQSVQRETKLETIRSESYLIRYEVEPENTRFEASIKWNNASKRISISVPQISRLTAYNYVSECVKDAVVKKFCICSI